MEPYEEKIEPKVYIQRALIGALYGLLLGTAFVVVMTFINSWLNPDVPFGVDWEPVPLRWILIGLGLTLIGALSCVFIEPIPGLLTGAVVAGFLALASALFQSTATEVSTGAKTIVLIFALVPVSVMSLPVILFLRRLEHQHEQALTLNRYVPRILLLVVSAVALGVIGGYYTKISGPALRAVRAFHTELQRPAEERNNKINELPGMAQHENMEYELFQQESPSTTEGFDVRAEYKDGYSFQCTVVTFPGSPAHILSCEEPR